MLIKYLNLNFSSSQRIEMSHKIFGVQSQIYRNGSRSHVDMMTWGLWKNYQPKNYLPQWLWYLVILLFSRQVASNSLWPHVLQHTRLPCPSLSPWVCSNSCPSSQRYHPTISSSVTPFSSCPQSFPASRSFPMSQFFASSGLLVGMQKWCPLTFYS